MKLFLSNSSQIPAYRQIYEQIRGQILDGTLPQGVCLPSIRNVARELKISVITVKTAYEMLAKDNFVTSAQGKGFFVNGVKNVELLRERIAAEKLEKDLIFYKDLGLSFEEFSTILKEKWQAGMYADYVGAIQSLCDSDITHFVSSDITRYASSEIRLSASEITALP